MTPYITEILWEIVTVMLDADLNTLGSKTPNPRPLPKGYTYQ